MQTVWQDLRYGVRMLGKNPLFTVVATLTLALGIGANSAIFSVVNTVLLRPLPYRDSEQLVAIFGTDNSGVRYRVLPMQFGDWQERSHFFEGMAGYSEKSFKVRAGQQFARVPALEVTSSFFSVLAVAPQFGRVFLPEENYAGRSKVVVLSHSLRRRLFSADHIVIGRTLHLDGEIYTIIGVMPEDFQFANNADVIVPVNLEVTVGPGGTVTMATLDVIARLRKGSTLQQANAEMVNIVRQNTSIGGPEFRAEVIPFHDLIVKNSRSALLLLFGAVALVLLIACANVANLLLARGVALQKEMAVRTALGASRARIIRQLMTQNLLLALLGGAGGLLLALWGVPLLVWLSPGSLPRLSEIDVDRSVFGFKLSASLLTVLLFGLVPAIEVSRIETTQALKEGLRSQGTGYGRFNWQNLLVVVEFALALVLLVGAGLLLNSFVRLVKVDLGFNPENLLTFKVSPPTSYRNEEQVLSLYGQALERIGALPGVAGAAIVDSLPLGGGVTRSAFQIEGHQASNAAPMVTQLAVSRKYFEVMSIPLLKGRYFAEQNMPESVGVVLINEAFARRFDATGDPVGKRLSFYHDDEGKPIWLEIVGVVGNVRQDALSNKPEPALYVPYTQRSDSMAPLSDMDFVARTNLPPSAFSAALQREMQAIGHNVPITDTKTVREVVAESVSDQRFVTMLLGAFAALALALAGVGVYGVMTHMAARRTHEIGVRLALGAQRRNVFGLMIGQSMVVALLGIAVGNVCALWLTRVLSSMLYNVSPTDPWTFACLSTLLAAVALIASYLPARRATRVDPLVALRYK